MDQEASPVGVRDRDRRSRGDVRELRDESAIAHLLVAAADVLQTRIVLLEVLGDDVQLQGVVRVEDDPDRRSRPAGRPAPPTSRSSARQISSHAPWSPPAGRRAPRRARAGRPATPGPEQPLLQRGGARSPVDPYTSRRRRGARRCSRRDLGVRRGPGRAAGATAAPVPEARRPRRRRPGAGWREDTAWVWPICKGLVEAHGGRSRAESAGAGHGTQITSRFRWLTRPTACDRRRPEPLPLASRSRRADAHPRGRRRPADAALRAGRARRSRLRPAHDGRPSGARLPPPDTPAPSLVLLDLMLPGAPTSPSRRRS